MAKRRNENMKYCEKCKKIYSDRKKYCDLDNVQAKQSLVEYLDPYNEKHKKLQENNYLFSMRSRLCSFFSYLLVFFNFLLNIVFPWLTFVFSMIFFN